jgi:tRNA threonylcarbamoyladenosine modification (KEOPS) complex  Pcc1 subunit
MRRDRFHAEAEVDVILRSGRELHAIAAALEPETLHPAGEKAQATITIRGHVLKIKFRARDSSSLRAIMSSYLRMIKAAANVCGSLLSLEGRGDNSGVNGLKVVRVRDEK